MFSVVLQIRIRSNPQKSGSGLVGILKIFRGKIRVDERAFHYRTLVGTADRGWLLISFYTEQKLFISGSTFVPYFVSGSSSSSSHTGILSLASKLFITVLVPDQWRQKLVFLHTSILQSSI